MRHISFLFDGISFGARSIHVSCSRHNDGSIVESKTFTMSAYKFMVYELGGKKSKEIHSYHGFTFGFYPLHIIFNMSGK